MPHDVFISYARRDNTDGRVSELGGIPVSCSP